MDIMQPITSALSEMRHPQIRVLADQSGVPFHTLLKIKSGETANPKVKTVQALLDVLCSSQVRKRAIQRPAS